MNALNAYIFYRIHHLNYHLLEQCVAPNILEMCAIRFRVPLSLVHRDQPTTITTIYIFLWIQFSENHKKII